MTDKKKDKDLNLETLLARLHSSPDDWVLLRLLLRTIRNKNLRRPDLVLQYAPLLLKHSSSLGNEGS